MCGLVLAIPFFFNNCGQRAFNAGLAYEPVTKFENELVALYGANLNPSICGESARYTCHQKVFGQDLKDSEVDLDLGCVEIAGKRVCPVGKKFTYNSAAAVAACKENCDEIYDYEEYSCVFDLATAEGIRPLSAVASTLEESIEAVYSACVRVSQLAQEGE